jgi:two-component sensor histidine kinase
MNQKLSFLWLRTEWVKYFPNERNYFPKEDLLLLKIIDNGVGRPAVEKAKGTCFGTKFVDLLPHQIDGKLMQNVSKGTVILTNFKKQVAVRSQL